MDFGTIVVLAVIGLAVVLAAWKLSPKFRDKSARYIDKDNDGKPFR